MTPKNKKKNWNFASKWILDEIGGNCYNYIKTTYSMNIKVPYLINYTDKANIFALKVNIRGPSNK